MDRRWTIPAAAGLLALENVAVLTGLLFAGTAPAGVVAALFLKFPLCVALLRMRVGAVALLILWESLTMGVALINTSLTPAGQLALFGSAMVGSSLLALSLPLYSPDRPGI
ncbi:MAG: hypothetical protein ACRDZ3_09850 [Acidimicrobiia bacterium]